MNFNKLGYLAFLIAFGAAWGILRLLGLDGEGPWMMIAGPLLAILDLVYRRVAGLKLLGDAARGPTILWIPAWVWGVFWSGLGAYYYFQAA